MRPRGYRNAVGHRRDSLWIAFLVHRLSGLLLACFLPLHFLTLSLAISKARLNAALSWTENPLVELAEMGLVFLLAVHMLGGLRVLAIENLPWSAAQKHAAAGAIFLAALVAIAFILRAA